MDYIVNPLADFLVWTFGILEKFENLPNYAFILIGFAGMFYWLKLQAKYNKEAASNPKQLK
jgi:hypothetical protein